jgi:hypothetical protein
MKERILEVLKNIHEAKEVIEINDLLGLTTSDELRELQDTLNQLVDEYLVFFTKKGKYILLDNLSGRGNYKNYKFQLTLKEMDISKEFETKIFTLAQNLKFLNKSQEDIIKLVENLFRKYHQKKEMFEKVKEQLPFFLS